MRKELVCKAATGTKHTIFLYANLSPPLDALGPLQQIPKPLKALSLTLKAPLWSLLCNL